MRLWMGLGAGALWALAAGCSGGAGKAPVPDGASDVAGGADSAADTVADAGADSGTEAGAEPIWIQPLPALPEYAGRIVVTPAAVLLTKAGDLADLHAEAFDASGQPMALTATVTWESSRPTDVTVDGAGHVTAVAALGSSQIRVRAGGLTSAPVMVLVAEPAAGTVLVSDAQVTAGPLPEDPAAAPVVGARVKLTVAGIPTLATGTILMAREGKAVAGRVVSTTLGASADTLEVVLETLPLLALFKRLNVEGSCDIDAAAMAQALALPPDANRQFTPDSELLELAFMLGSKVKCEAKLLTGALTGDATVDLRPSMTFTHRFIKNDDTGQWTEVMAKLDGTLSISGKVGLEFSAMIGGTITCDATLAKIPIPIAGALSAVLSLRVPLGVKGEIVATLGAVPLTANLELKGESKVTLGFQYTPQGGTTDLSKVMNKFEMKPVFTAPGGDTPLFLLKASAAFGGTAGLDIVVFLGLGSFSLLEAALLLQTEVTAGAVSDGLAFGTSYDLKPTLEVGAGEDAKKGLEWLGGGVALASSTSIDLPVIARSPRGKLTAEPMTVLPNKPVKLKVELQADTVAFLGLHNVVDVRVYRGKREGTGFEVVGTVNGAPGKTSYEVMWTPTFLDRDAGGVAFWAGVTTKLMPGFALESNTPPRLDVKIVEGLNPRWKGTVTSTCTEEYTEAHGDTHSLSIRGSLDLEHLTEADAFMAKAKVTGSGMAALKNTKTSTINNGTCLVSVTDEDIGLATEFQEGLTQTKFNETTGEYVLLGVGTLVGKRHSQQTQVGSCKAMSTTAHPEVPYSESFAYNIVRTVDPTSSAFSGSQDYPAATPEDTHCVITWDFHRL